MEKCRSSNHKIKDRGSGSRVNQKSLVEFSPTLLCISVFNYRSRKEREYYIKRIEEVTRGAYIYAKHKRENTKMPPSGLHTQ